MIVIAAQMKTGQNWRTVEMYEGTKRGSETWLQNLLIRYRPTKPKMRLVRLEDRRKRKGIPTLGEEGAPIMMFKDWKHEPWSQTQYREEIKHIPTMREKLERMFPPGDWEPIPRAQMERIFPHM